MPAIPHPVPLPPFTPHYSHVERALAASFGIPDEVRKTAFRSWLGSLQKAGLLGARARIGKGAALTYEGDQFRRLIIACELAEFGAPPAVIFSFIENWWTKKLVPIFTSAERDIMTTEPGPNDVVLILVGLQFRSGTLTGAEPTPSIGKCTLGQMPGVMAMALQDDPDALPPRALAVNLTARLRAFHRGLSAAWLDKEEPPVAVSKARRRRKAKR